MLWRFALLGATCIGAAASAAEPTPQGAAGTVQSAPAHETNAAARGLAYAQETCAVCHAVAADETVSPVPEATSFATIANTPGMNTMALDVWLHTAHPTMPNLIVDQSRIKELSAYLASLRTKD
jgi:mono/diheme cytochrome c family protein